MSMNRLTRIDAGGCITGVKRSHGEYVGTDEMLLQLSKYEDTGLTPEQIPQMSQFQAKCEEVNRLKEMSEKLQSAYDNLKLMIDDCKKPTCDGCKREKTGRFDYKALGYCRSCSRAYKDEYKANEQDEKQGILS